MDFLIPQAYAQTAAGSAPSPLLSMLPLVLIFVFMWFFIMRPHKKRMDEHKKLVEGLSKGDEVITNGGLTGRIDEMGESFITVEIADGVKVKVQRHAITHVLPKGTLKSA
jgi:preprotein translocase subunit YajC